MIGGKRILAVVPARGGSKGVPLKNIRPVNGVPLIAMTGRVIAQVPEIDRAVVSTDHAEIARVAKESGIEAPFMRPESLSGDIVADWDVLVHALAEMDARDATRYDVVLMLQPTSPLRTPDQIRSVLRKVIEEGFDSVWTVTETDVKFHPLKQLKIEDGRMDYFDPRGGGIIARQQLGKVYHRNGVAYAMTRECLLDTKKIKGEKAGAVIIAEPIVNIDTLDDFKTLETLLAGAAGRGESR
jgi:CMP-N,N'-diacetyllegionaminic acid synthase